MSYNFHCDAKGLTSRRIPLPFLQPLTFSSHEQQTTMTSFSPTGCLWDHLLLFPFCSPNSCWTRWFAERPLLPPLFNHLHMKPEVWEEIIVVIQERDVCELGRSWRGPVCLMTCVVVPHRHLLLYQDVGGMWWQVFCGVVVAMEVKLLDQSWKKEMTNTINL